MLSWTVGIVALAFVVLWVGTLVHECAHGLVGVAYGARVERLNVLGLDLYPELRFDNSPGYYGRVWLDRSLPDTADHWMRAAGSLGTLLVALACQAWLWTKPPGRKSVQLLVIGFCFSWLDIFWHTSLALLGRRSMMYAESYNALVALGAPGWLVSAAIVVTSALLLAATIVRWRMLWRGARAVSGAVEPIGGKSGA